MQIFIKGISRYANCNITTLNLMKKMILLEPYI